MPVFFFVFFFVLTSKPEESGELQDEEEEEDEEEDIYADSESLLGQLISSAMPNSRGAAPSRLPRTAPARAPPPLPQLNESGGGGSDDSCCSADNADILEACIASAMPSKPGKTSAAALTEQSGKLPQQQQRFNLGKKSRTMSQDFEPASILSGSWSRSQFLLYANESKLLSESEYAFSVYKMSGLTESTTYRDMP
jgi:hypothetical protein